MNTSLYFLSWIPISIHYGINIGPNNDLLPVQHQAITRTDVIILSIGHWEHKVKYTNEMQYDKR